MDVHSKHILTTKIVETTVNEIDLAIEREKKIEKYQTDNNRRIGTVEANPNTEVYKIVEYLMKKG